MKHNFKKATSWLLTLAMIVTMLPAGTLTAFAAEDTGLCEHHPAHTAECGYVAAAAEVPCGHEHTAECYTLGELPDADSGNVYDLGADTNALDCQHVHDAECGYIAAVEAHECHYECGICAAQELIDALPTANAYLAMDDDEQVAAQDALMAAYEAYSALPAEDQAQVNTDALYALQEAVMNGGEALTEEYEVVWSTSASDTNYAYGTFAEAVAAANAAGSTVGYIRLSASVELTDTARFSQTQDLALELTGWPLSAAATASPAISVTNGNLTVTDETTSGSITATGGNVFTVSGGTLTLSGGAYSAAAGSAVISYSGGSIVITGTTQNDTVTISFATAVDNVSDVVTLPDGWALHNADGQEVSGSVTQDTTLTACAKVSVVASGTCGASGNGENVTWKITGNAAGYTLTISGSGAMADYPDINMPWYSYRENITSVVVSEGVTNIGSYAFYDCSSLETVSLPTGLVSIGEFAFDGCSSLESIAIPDSVTAIPSYCFYDCSKLGTVHIGSGVASIGSWVFYGCTSLTGFTVSESNENYKAVDGVLLSEDSKTLLAYPLAKAGEYSIPSGVETIQSGAFSYSKVTSVTIPASVTTIEDETFNHCASLTQFVVDGESSSFSAVDGVLLYEEYEGQTTLIAWPGGKTGAVTVPDGVEAIGERAFQGCAVTSVTLPDSLATIGEYAFFDCTGLSEIEISAGVTDIGGNAFYDCTALTTVTFHSAPTLGYVVFGNCAGLTTLNLYAVPTFDFGDYGTFYGCTLANITVNLMCNDEANVSTFTSAGFKAVTTTLHADSDTDDDELCDGCNISLHTHVWANGVCTNGCGQTHDHKKDSDWNNKDGICITCGLTCTHGGETPTYANGVCTTCGAAHDPHSFDTNGFCTCGGYEPAVKVTADNYGELGFTAENYVGYLNYYAIGNAGQLYWFADYVTEAQGYADAVLTDNIVVNPGTFDASGNYTPKDSETRRDWTRIGNANKYYRYQGTFDGQNHTISGLYFNDSNAEYVGLFGWVYNGTVKNVGVVNSYFSGYYLVGGVAGYNYGGTVQNCYNAGTINATYGRVGGVVGDNHNGGQVIDCYNTGNVSGASAEAGGVAGCNSSTVSNCYNTGTVSSNGYNVGGVIGYNIDGAVVTNCYYLADCAKDGSGVAQQGIGAANQGSYTEDIVREDNTVVTAVKDEDTFKSGAVAYLLNGGKSTGVWKQTLGAGGDASPNFTGKTVYQSGTEYTNHEHNWSYEASGNQIQAKCNGTDCTLTGSVTITLNDPSATYTGDAYPVSIDFMPADAENVMDLPAITYTKGNVPLADSEEPTDAGEYTATLTLGEGTDAKEAKLTYTIAKAPLTITAATIDSKTYDGSTTAEISSVTLSGTKNNETLTLGTDYTATAVFDNADAGDGKIVNVTVTLNDTAKANNYTLSSSSYSLTNQTIGKASLTPASGNLEVINRHAGSYTFDFSGLLPTLSDGQTYGDVTYSLGTISLDGSYYDSDTASISGSILTLPIKAVESTTESDIGTITVTVTSQNYADSTLTLTVKSANKTDVSDSISLTVPITVYGSEPAPKYSFNGTSVGTPVWTLTYSNDNGSTWKTLAELKNADGKLPAGGSYKVKVHYEDDTQIGEQTCAFTVFQASTTFTIPTGLTATYGDLLSSITLPSAAAGDTPGTWRWLKPNDVVGDVGSRTHSALFEPEDDNYSTEPVQVTITVGKANSEVTAAPTAKPNLVYGGTAQELVNAGTATGGEMQYSLDGATWGTAIPTGTNAGDYTVYYKVVGDSNHNDTTPASVTVTIAKANGNLTADSTSITKTFGDEAFDLLSALNKNGSDGALSYVSANTNVVTVDAGGKVTIVGAGSSTITVTMAEGTNHTADTLEINVQVNKADIASATVASIKDQLHTGSAITPEPTVTFNSKTLVKDTDYELAYSDNTNEGTATITITGKGNFEGTKDVTFKIMTHSHVWSYKAEGNTITATCSGEVGTCPDAEQSVTLVIPENTTYTGAVDYTAASYTGSIEGVTPTISYKGTNTDYDSAEAPVNADTYTVTMSAGDKTVSNTFTISPKSIANCEAKLSQSSFEYSGKAPELTVTVTDGGVGNSTLTKDSDYTVGEVTGINKGNYKLTVTGRGNYTGSVELDYSITAKEVTITGATIQNVTYNPNGYALKVIGVTFNGVVENETLDYSATAEVSTNAVGTQNATVTVTLNDSNYYLSSNTFTSTVSIDKAVATVTKAPTAKALTYNGGDQALVTAGETSSGTMQYSLDNSTWGTAIPNGTDAGSYTVYYKVVGDSNHSDSTVGSVSVKIAKAPVTFTVTGNSVKESEVSAPVVTSTPAVAFTVTYGGANELPTAAGTYDIAVKITDSNYRHASSVNGEAINIGVLTIYKVEAPKEYSITFAGDGSTGISMPNAVAGTVRTIPTPTSTPKDEHNFDKLFQGWSDGKVTYKPGEAFTQPEADVTLTAVWVAEVHTISGSVQQYLDIIPNEQNTKTLGSIVVTLMYGSEQVAQFTTNSDGTYSFKGCLQGIYNLVAESEGIRQTILVNLGHVDANNMAIILPAGKTNTTVAVEPGTPAVVVGGLEGMMTEINDNYTSADKEVVEAGGEVEIKMEVKENPEPEKKQEIITKAEEEQSKATIGIYIDLDLTKTVTDKNGNHVAAQSKPIEESHKLLENVIFLPGHLQGKAHYHIFREHKGDVKEMQDLTSLSDEERQGKEGFVVDRTAGTITIYSMKYSTFAIAYVDHYIVSFDANGGTCDTATMDTSDGYKLASLPTPTRSGYSFNGWYDATTGGNKITTDTVFSADVTVYAQWTQNSSGGGGGYVAPTYSISVESTENGEIKANRTYASYGSTVTITVTPDEGYKLESLTVTTASGKEIEVTAKGDGTYTFKMPSGKVTVTPVFVSEGTSTGVADCPKDDTCPIAEFTDVDPGAWYHDGIHYALENGMMAGYGNGLFGTNDSITRGQIVTILWRLEGSPVVNYLMNFEDVPAEKYYTEAIRWANSQGIVGGYGNGKFGPDDPITRQQLATMVYRYEQYKGGGFTGAWAFRLDFKDIAEMSDYAYEPMCWCVMNGIVGGYGNGYLGPNDGATRAQAAAMLMRYCTLNNDEN